MGFNGTIAEQIRRLERTAEHHEGLCERVEDGLRSLGLPAFIDEGSVLAWESLDLLVGPGLREELIKAGWTAPAIKCGCGGEATVGQWCEGCADGFREVD